MFYLYANGELLWRQPDDSRVILNPKMTGEVGKAGALEFNVPPTNKLYRSLQKYKTLITMEWDEREIFRGRVLALSRGFNNVKTVYCEGDLNYLLDSVQPPNKFSGTTHQFFDHILAQHNGMVEESKRFARGNVTVEDRPIEVAGISDEVKDDDGAFNYKQIAINASSGDWPKTLDYMQSSLINYCGGYLRTRNEGGVVYLDYLLEYGHTATQEIEFGVNMLDFVEDDAPDEFFTVLIPLGDDGLTIESVNGGSKELEDPTAVARYGRVIKTHKFDSVNDAATLLENGQRYLESELKDEKTFTIKAVDLHLTDPDIQEIAVGDVVPLRSAPHDISDGVTCTKIEYDFTNLGNTTYTFGKPRQTLTERYRKDMAQTKEDAESAAVDAGGGGGGGAGQKVDEEIQKFYEEWVDWDPANPDGRVSLGGLYKDYINGKEVIKSRTGLDLDADPEPGAPSINLYSMKNDLDAAGNTIATQAATIQAYQKDSESRLELYAGRLKNLDDRESRHYAAFNLIANDLESAIEGKADRVTFETKVFQITEDMKNQDATIASFSSDLTDIRSEVTRVRKLVADEIDAVKANLDWLTSKRINCASVSASSGMYVNGNSVVTQVWVREQGYIDSGYVDGSFSRIGHTHDGRYAMQYHTHNYSSPGHDHSVVVYVDGKACYGYTR